MKLETKTTVTLNIKDLAKALESGSFTGRKIKSIEWEYKSVMTDAGRGCPTYENRVSGLVIELKD